MALLDGDTLLKEEIWNDSRKNVEEMVPRLQAMLEELGLQKSDITQIVCVRGPGSFTAVRTGVTFANALAEGLGAQLHSLDTFELLKGKVASTDPILPLVQAGGQDVALQHDGEVKVGPLHALLAPLSHHSFKVVAELRETQDDQLHSICLEKGWTKVEGHQLLTLGEFLATFSLDQLKKVEQIEPYYLKNPWKS